MLFKYFLPSKTFLKFYLYVLNVEQTHIPLAPWTDVFNKAIHTWDEKVTKDFDAKQNEIFLLQWKTKMNPNQVKDCNLVSVMITSPFEYCYLITVFL